MYNFKIDLGELKGLEDHLSKMLFGELANQEITVDGKKYKIIFEEIPNTVSTEKYIEELHELKNSIPEYLYNESLGEVENYTERMSDLLSKPELTEEEAEEVDDMFNMLKDSIREIAQRHINKLQDLL